MHLLGIAHDRRAQLSGICDTDLSAASELASLVDSTSLTWGECLDRSDLVVIATPPDTHAELVADALDRGRHVLVETPLTTSAADSAALVELAGHAADEGIVAAYGANLRHSPPMLQAADRAVGVGPVEHLGVAVVGPRPSWAGPAVGDPMVDLGPHVGARRDAVPRRDARGAAGAVHRPGRRTDDTRRRDAARLEVRTTGEHFWVLDLSWGGEPDWSAQLAGERHVVRIELQPNPSVEVDGLPVAPVDELLRTRGSIPVS
ncbi:MAG: Gfo/Idh/MocA family oxidoreductase [Microthrixaceae bacterium]